MGGVYVLGNPARDGKLLDMSNADEPSVAPELGDDRQRTDEHLQVERVKADDLLAEVGELDHERERVDQALLDAQRRDEPSALEQIVVDAVADERERADELLRLERERGGRESQALERERLATDRSLVEERHTTDELIHAHASRLRIVSHDLKNPLQAIVYNIALLRQLATSIPASSAARLLGAAEEIEWAAKAMDRLVADLLTNASLELGDLPLRREAHQVGPLLVEVMTTFEPLAAARWLRLRLRPPPAALRVLCDAGRLSQVLSNIVGNAIKFTPEGGAVDVDVEASGAEVRFRVSDSGPGLAAGDAARVFERHFRGAHGHPGMGLGLFIAKTLVDAHGGRIWCENRTDAPGAVFSFTLPAAPA